MNLPPKNENKNGVKKHSKGIHILIVDEIKKNWILFLMITPLIVYYILFHYMVMYGAQIAFKNYSPARGIHGSPWVGFEHFITFFQ